MPAIISVLLLISGLIGYVLGQKAVRARYDFFFRQMQPEDVDQGVTAYVRQVDGGFYPKIIVDVLTFGNGWLAVKTDDGAAHALEECCIKDNGLNAMQPRPIKGKWISRKELDEYQNTFEKPKA